MPTKQEPTMPSTADSNGNAPPSEPPKKRKRAAYSCTECSKGKARCDRQNPCGRCVARRIPHLCHYLIEGYEDPLEITRDTRERLERIEKLLVDTRQELQASRDEVKRMAKASPPTQLPSNHLAPSSRPGPSQLQPPQKSGSISGPRSSISGPAATGAPTSQPSASPLSARSAVMSPPDPDSNYSMEPRPKAGFVKQGRYYGPSAMGHIGQGSASEIIKALDVPDPESPQAVMGMGGDGRPSRILIEILHDLPPRALCDELIRLYFDNINLIRYPINKDAFMEAYEGIWQAMATYALDAYLVHKLPLFCIMLGISALSAPMEVLHHDPTLPPAQQAERRAAQANDMFQVSRRAAAYSDTLLQGRGDIALVMADILTVRFLLISRRAPDALPVLGSAVFRAQALGLHRHPMSIDGVEPADAEERRMVWSYVYHHDRYVALLLGRPLSISDKSCDAEPPQNLSEDGVPLPLTEVTLRSFLVHRYRLAHIMTRIVDEAYAIRGSSYDVVVEIDNELREWASQIPGPISPWVYGHVDDRTPSDPSLICHRHLLTTEYCFALISLHRPYLVHDRHNPRYQLSRDRCLQAAMDDLWARTVFSVPGNKHPSMGSYRVTNSIIILGITLLLYPSPETVRSIQRCLSDFLAVRQTDSNLLNDIKIKEAAMIELLQLRADRTLSRVNSRAGSPMDNSDMNGQQPPIPDTWPMAPPPNPNQSQGQNPNVGPPMHPNSFSSLNNANSGGDDTTMQPLYNLLWTPQALQGSVYENSTFGVTASYDSNSNQGQGQISNDVPLSVGVGEIPWDYLNALFSSNQDGS